MSFRMLVDEQISSQDGYTMLVVDEELSMNNQTGHYFSEHKIAWKLRRSCRKSCQGNWGYSGSTQVTVMGKNNRYNHILRTYFAFADEEDRLTAILKMGDKVSIAKMWPSRIKFNIYKTGD